MNEIWNDIKGYEGRYQVSNLGRVKSLSFMQRYKLRNGVYSFRKTSEKVISQQLINSGYFVVHLYLDNKRTAVLVHRLVASAFIGEIGALDTNHINGDKQDNRSCNLEIIPRDENHLHAVSLRLNKQAMPVVNPDTFDRYDSIAQAAKGARRSHRYVSSHFARVI